MKQIFTYYDLPAKIETINLGERLSAICGVGDVLCLFGELGSGKSTLARAFIRALCGADIEVPSPTFTLVQEYDGPDFNIIHADLYRLNDSEEIIETGLDENFAKVVTLIEWPERLGRFLPKDRLDIILSSGRNGGRTAQLVAHGSRWEKRIEG